MSRYYKGKHAHHYNTRWLRFNTRTFDETLAMIDITALRNIQKEQGRLPLELPLKPSHSALKLYKRSS